MAEKTVILTDAAPAPIGTYSQAIKHGNTVYLSGQIGLDPKSGKLVGPDTASQLTQILKNIEAVLKFSGLTPGHIVRIQVFLIDLQDMPLLNKVLSEFFIYAPPARTSVQVVALPAGARIEIEATAVIGSGGFGG